MTRKEKKLLTVMVSLFGLYFLPFKIIPAIYSWFEQEYDKVYSLKAHINRYKDLWVNRDQWDSDYKKALQEWQQINDTALQGTTRDVVAGKLQDLLKQVASKHNLRVRTLDLPEFAETKDWLFVSQSMEFEGNSQDIMDFITDLENDKTTLHIGSLEIRIFQQKQLFANITVTGFNHSVKVAEQNNENA
jgi:hypothetical protein